MEPVCCRAMDLSDSDMKLPLAPDQFVPPHLQSTQDMTTIHDAFARMHQLAEVKENVSARAHIVEKNANVPGKPMQFEGHNVMV